MAKIRIKLKTDVAAEVLPRELSKSERRQIQIIQNAIRLCARGGVEALAYERIARECGVTRHLVMHYFPDRDTLVERAMEYIWASLKLEILDSVGRETGAEARMRAYIASNFKWARTHHEEMVFITLVLHYASSKRVFRVLNSRLMRLGQERILGILKDGIAEGVFVGIESLEIEAKGIQIAVLGHLVSAVTEDTLFEDDALEKYFVRKVLRQITGKNPR